MKHTYSDDLPRILKRPKGRCEWMDGDGNRCRKKATLEDIVHENPEHANRGWFAILVCNRHKS